MYYWSCFTISERAVCLPYSALFTWVSSREWGFLLGANWGIQILSWRRSWISGQSSWSWARPGSSWEAFWWKLRFLVLVRMSGSERNTCYPGEGRGPTEGWGELPGRRAGFREVSALPRMADNTSITYYHSLRLQRDICLASLLEMFMILYVLQSHSISLLAAWVY